MRKQVFNKFKSLLEHINTRFRNYICHKYWLCKSIETENSCRGNESGASESKWCRNVFSNMRYKIAHVKAQHVNSGKTNK